MTLAHEEEPTFLVLDYVTITQDPKTALVRTWPIGLRGC